MYKVYILLVLIRYVTVYSSKYVKFCTSSAQGVRYMHNMSKNRIESGFEPFWSRCTKAFLTGPLCPSYGSPVP